MHPQKIFWIQRLWDCFFNQFWANTMLLRGQTTEFHMYEYPPSLLIASYRTGFGFTIINLTSHTFCRWSLYDYVWLEEQKEETLGRVLSHSSQPSCKFQHVTCVLNWGPCIEWLSNDVNRQCHASKPLVRRLSGPFETRLTGLVAMALIYDYQTADITEHSNTERNCVKVWWYHMTVAKIHSTRA